MELIDDGGGCCIPAKPAPPHHVFPARAAAQHVRREWCASWRLARPPCEGGTRTAPPSASLPACPCIPVVVVVRAPTLKQMQPDLTTTPAAPAGPPCVQHAACMRESRMHGNGRSMTGAVGFLEGRWRPADAGTSSLAVLLWCVSVCSPAWPVPVCIACFHLLQPCSLAPLLSALLAPVCPASGAGVALALRTHTSIAGP